MPGGCVLKRRRWRSCRGNRALETPIHFARFEPYVVPKRSLTGDTTERVDTRVLQVLYQFHPGDLPVYVGQQMDVFIEAPPIGSAPAGGPGPTPWGHGRGRPKMTWPHVCASPSPLVGISGCVVGPKHQPP